MKKSASGFTIVELLIVIVVVGILATISLVAYNGIQDRARSVKRQVALKDYDKIIEIYRAKNQGEDPPGGPISASSLGVACLGTYDMYPPGIGYESGQCAELPPYTIGDHPENIKVFVDPEYNQKLQKNVGNLPNASYPSVSMRGHNGSTVRQRGVIVFTDPGSGSFKAFYLQPLNPPAIIKTEADGEQAMERSKEACGSPNVAWLGGESLPDGSHRLHMVMCYSLNR